MKSMFCCVVVDVVDVVVGDVVVVVVVVGDVGVVAVVGSWSGTGDANWRCAAGETIVE